MISTTVILVWMEESLFRISDASGKWRTEEKLAGESVQSIVSDPKRPSRIYCGSFGKGLWKSDDCSETWSQVKFGQSKVMALVVSNLERSFDGFGAIYAGI